MKVVVIFSGGMDSTTLLYKLKAEAKEVKALGINYGQRHVKELAAARVIADRVGVQYRIADLRGILAFLGGSSQTDSSIPVPEGHYTQESMKATVVPNRNMMMLSVATAWAISSKFDAVAYGAHKGDHAIYPDCRATFAQTMKEAIRTCDWRSVDLLTPFLGYDKADIVRLGASLHVPFELTWSCYKGGDVHCGKCGTCVERREAFQMAGILDPTIYEAAAA